MIIDGQELADKKEKILKEKMSKLKIQGIVPKIGVIVMVDDEAGELYCGLKHQAADRMGIEFQRYAFDFKQKEEMKKRLQALSLMPEVHGIMIQRPGRNWVKNQGLSEKEFELWWQEMCELIAPTKDVDGLREDSLFTQATVRAVETILNKIEAKGKILIVGQGMVGEKLSQRLRAENISSRDKYLAKLCEEADILITCSGRPGLIKNIKPGAIVIDVGWPKGDVDFNQVKDKASAISPVPGGVGPVSVVCLLENLVKAAEIVYSNSL